jgi:hypothetical protein
MDQIQRTFVSRRLNALCDRHLNSFLKNPVW